MAGSTDREGDPAGPPSHRDDAGPWIRSTALLLGISTGVFQPYVAIVLVERGLDVSTVGLVLAAGSLTGMLANPAWGYIADTRLGSVRMLQLLALGGSAAFLALNLRLVEPLVALLYVLGATLGWAAWVPLTDSLTIRISTSGSGYARVRLLTSLAFAITAIMSGFLYLATGYGASLLVFPALAVVYALVAGAAPARLKPAPGRRSRARETPPGPSSGRGDEGRSGVMSPRLAAVLVVTALMLIGQSGANSFLGLRVVELGGSPAQVAGSASIAAFAEVPAMLAAGWLAGRLGLRAAFLLFGVLFLATFAGWAVLTDVDLLIASRLLSGFAYGGVLVSAVLTVRELVPEHRQATGQTVFQAACFGLTAIVASLVGGAMHARFGFAGFFGLCAALAGAALLVAPLAYPGQRPPRQVLRAALGGETGALPGEPPTGRGEAR